METTGHGNIHQRINGFDVHSAVPLPLAKRPWANPDQSTSTAIRQAAHRRPTSPSPTLQVPDSCPVLAVCHSAAPGCSLTSASGFATTFELLSCSCDAPQPTLKASNRANRHSAPGRHWRPRGGPCSSLSIPWKNTRGRQIRQLVGGPFPSCRRPCCCPGIFREAISPAEARDRGQVGLPSLLFQEPERTVPPEVRMCF